MPLRLDAASIMSTAVGTGEKRRVRSMHRPGRRRIRELPDGIDDPAPHFYAGIVTGCLEVADPSRAFQLGRVAVPTNHQIGGAPDIDFGYHGEKTRRCVSINK